MGYPVTRGNGKWFKLFGEQMAFAVVPDDSTGYVFALFRQGSSGEWLAIPPLIVDGLTNAQIMAYGSVAAFIEAQFPVMESRVEAYISAGPKPSQNDKPACVGYDLALDVDYDPETFGFFLNKTPPLSHAR